jgi:hypothetical protein
MARFGLQGVELYSEQKIYVLAYILASAIPWNLVGEPVIAHRAVPSKQADPVLRPYAASALLLAAGLLNLILQHRQPGGHDG